MYVNHKLLGITLLSLLLQGTCRSCAQRQTCPTGFTFKVGACYINMLYVYYLCSLFTSNLRVVGTYLDFLDSPYLLGDVIQCVNE